MQDYNKPFLYKVLETNCLQASSIVKDKFLRKIVLFGCPLRKKIPNNDQYFYRTMSIYIDKEPASKCIEIISMESALIIYSINEV